MADPISKVEPEGVFMYTPLQDPHTEIRVIHVHPGSGSEPLSCELRTLQLIRRRRRRRGINGDVGTLDNENKDVDEECEADPGQTAPGHKQEYIALSYAWGDPTPTETILCHGKKLHLTRNLYLALLDLRNHHGVQRVWADAICINQKDDQEKGIQVGRMGKIYERALATLVWLGLHGTNNPFKPIRDTLALVNEMAVREPRLDPQSVDWHGVGRLFEADWFSRRWIVQEFVLSRQVHFVSGQARISGDDVASFAHSVIGNDMRNIAQLSCFLPDSLLQAPVRTRMNVYNIFSMIFLRTTFWIQTSSLPFRGLLLLTQNFSVTDMRDAVYSVLGLYNRVRFSGLETTADYTLRPAQVFLSAIKLLMQEASQAQAEGIKFIRDDMSLALPASGGLFPFAEAQRRGLRIESFADWLSLYPNARKPTSQPLSGDERSGTLPLLYTALAGQLDDILTVSGSYVGVWATVLLDLTQLWCTTYGLQTHVLGSRRHSMPSLQGATSSQNYGQRDWHISGQQRRQCV